MDERQVSRFDRVQRDIVAADTLALSDNEVGLALCADSLPLAMMAVYQEVP